MPTTLAIQPIGPFRASLRVPGSKSLTNRALLLAALAQGQSVLRDPLWADDPQQMVQALRTLGYDLQVEDAGRVVRIAGRSGLGTLAQDYALHLGNAGTAYRFLTAACCLGQGCYQLDGIPRMRQRPIGQLVDALTSLGASIEYLGENGFPPLKIRGTGLRGGQITMAPTLSSQYLSALLQVGPYCRDGLTLLFDGPVTSRPYVQMTLALMARFGVTAEVDPAFTRIRVHPGSYRATDYAVEPDASSASYFLAAAAIIPGSSCTIEGLGRSSLQGDVGFADVLHQMGAGLAFGSDFITVVGPKPGQSLTGIDIDLNHMPDMAQTLAVVAIFADGPTRIRNIGNLRVKETDRLAALQTELTKLGVCAIVQGDDLLIEPPASGVPGLHPAAIDTYNDHRMAMSFAVAGLRLPGIVIRDPGCVDKTFPEFFEYLKGLGRSGVAAQEPGAAGITPEIRIPKSQ